MTAYILPMDLRESVGALLIVLRFHQVIDFLFFKVYVILFNRIYYQFKSERIIKASTNKTTYFRKLPNEKSLFFYLMLN